MISAALLLLTPLQSMSSSDASLVSFLQSELLLLSNEIKKKYPEIKEVLLGKKNII